MRIARFILLTVLGSLALAAAPPTNSLAPPTAASVHPFNLHHSKMTVYVFKQGIFAFAADNHEVDAPIASGSYDAAKNAVELTVDATKMQVLDPSMPADRRATVQSNMSGPMVLDATKYPTIAFRSTKMEAGASGHWTVTGDLTLHGQTHPITLDVVKVDATHFNGSVMVRQTAFGITPIRIAGGTVKVKDDVKVVFEIDVGET